MSENSNIKWTNDLMGKWVSFSHRFVRSRSGNVCSWHKMKYEGKGMVIGRRLIYNGRVYYDEFSSYFTQHESIPCLAVVRNGRENHIYIPLNSFELVEQ